MALTLCLLAACANIPFLSGGLLKSLPFNNHVSGAVTSRKDCADKANVLVFGTCNDEFVDTEIVKTLDALLDAYKLQDQVNLLFWGISDDAEALRDWSEDCKFSSASVFSGGDRQMWDALANENITTITTPVIFWIDENGKSVFTDVAVKYDKTTFVERLSSLIGREFVSLPNDVLHIQVLADTMGTFDERRQAIDEYFADLYAAQLPKDADVYEETPRTAVPYAPGKLTDEYVASGLTALNFVRFLAGLPDDVSTTVKLNELAQSGALLMASSEYGHNPPQPLDMDDELYRQALTATQSSNIAYNSGGSVNYLQHFSETLLYGWIADYDRYNIVNLGHRRWFLNPDMQFAGFGQVDDPKNGLIYRYSAVFAQDASRPELVPYQAIAYPSGLAFPAAFFKGDYPWSVTVNPHYYSVPDIDNITVTLSGGGNVYTFSNASSGASSSGFDDDSDYFTVNTDDYGVPNCIIFRPANVDAYSGEYTVTIDGICTVDGAPAALSYSVEFY
jgi:hypothetical protein